jgi:hypothetical protein
MTLLESYAMDISSYLHRAVAASQAGDRELALSLMQAAKRIMQEMDYSLWHAHHTSGVVK